MGKGLQGKRIVIAGTRKIEEISTLIEKQGGVAIGRPLQGTVFLADKQVEPDLHALVEKGSDWLILTTGIGTQTLLDVSERLGIQAEFLNILHHAKIAARGYKTLAVLKKLGITPVAVDDDGTNSGLIRSLEQVDFTGKKVTIQLHGESAPRLIQFLEDKGAIVSQILPYQHTPPQIESVQKVCIELIASEVDAVCFTTAVQVRSLFNYAKEKNVDKELIQAFNTNSLAVAVGKVTAEALKEEGVERIISPENERMGAMIIELSRYFEELSESNN